MKIMLLFLIFTCIVNMENVGAQQRVNRPAGDSAVVNRLGGELQIDKVKTASLIVAMRANQVSIDQLMKNTSLTPPERQVQVQALLRDREEKVKAVLSPEEWQRLSSFLEIRFHDNRNKFRTAVIQDKAARGDTLKVHQ